MKKRTALKGFTLLEMLIVMIIIGILAVVLTESYISISKVALRIEQQKNISEESLILTQIFQSIADETTIDYNKIILDDNGYTDTLYLKGGDGISYKIYTEDGDDGKCLELEGNFEPDENGSYTDISETVEKAKKCKLVLEEISEEDGDGNKTILNTSGKVIISKVKFRVIPYKSDEFYFDPENHETDILNKLHQPAFWMFIHLYSPLYQPVGPNKIDQPLQLFFNLKL